MIDLYKAEDIPGVTEKYGVPATMKVLKYDFVLVTDKEVNALRDEKALEVAKKLGSLKLENGSLVKDVEAKN